MEKLIKFIKNNNNDVDLDLIQKAYDFAVLAHGDHKRFSGEPFIVHPIGTAEILAQWHLDTNSIVAGLLHDTIEDGAAKREDIVSEFGETIAILVDGVTNARRIHIGQAKEEEFTENLRKMFLAMAKDFRVILIKLAERLNNMRTIEFLSPDRRTVFSRESIEIYAPLAERLGMSEVKGELEDLAFPWIDSEGHSWVKKYTAGAYKESKEHIEEIKRKLFRRFSEENIKADIHGRAKHVYSLYKKLLRPEVKKDLTLVYDLVALRILVDTVEECYTVLGIVHKIYKPVPNLGISDYIAFPKPNGYRSIHTRVFGPDGRIIEIQIRTKKMHDEAENGVAAHWHYASLKSQGAIDEKLEAGTFAPEEKLSWVKELANWQKEIGDNKEFFNELKFDILSKRIYVFTPKGDVYDLPINATPIDFAYAVHSKIGDRAVGAKINNKLVGLDTKLKSGDVCEILITKDQKKPNRDWLNFVVTRHAKKEIHHWMKVQNN